jgi:O-antigen ligase
VPGKANRSRRGGGGARGASRVEPALVTTAMVLLTALLVVAGAVALDAGLVYALIPVGIATYVLLLTCLGTERLAVLTLLAAFVTAPMYKGLSPSLDSPVTPTDGLFVLGFALLMPTVAARRVHLPALYFVGLIIVVVTGCLASVLSADPLTSFIALTLWLMVMGALPIAFALWSPGSRVIELLAWAYVSGHMISIAYALVNGPGDQGRYGGLAAHPNYYAQAGMMSIALLIYLFFRHSEQVLLRLVVLGAAAASLYSIDSSGSRAALVVTAVLVLMIPVVERSAITGFVWALLGALAIVVLPLVIGVTGEQSSLARLVGNTNSSFSDQERTAGLASGWDRFWAHPLTGDGLLELFDIHNMFLEVAVAIGIFGLVGYLMVLAVFARPLFGHHPHRRLAYTAWAYLGFGATIPSLYDRSIWGPIALSVVTIATAARWSDDERGDTPAAPGSSTASTPAVGDPRGRR